MVGVRDRVRCLFGFWILAPHVYFCVLGPEYVEYFFGCAVHYLVRHVDVI